MQLNELLNDYVNSDTLSSLTPITVSHISTDTHDLTEGSVFFALKGIKSHGLEYLSSDQIKKLSAIIYEPTALPQALEKVGIPLIPIDNLSKKMSAIASRFYHHPSRRCRVIGITGTNGKTSSSHFIAKLLDGAVIGTMGYGMLNDLHPLTHTTPDPLTTQRVLQELCAQVDNISIEVSSHGLSLHRVESVSFHTVVFTNISLDHLDFYKRMQDYVLAKKRLFSDFSAKYAVINADDEYAEEFGRASVDNGQHVLWFGRTNAVRNKEEYLQYKKVNANAAGTQVDLHYKLMGNTGQIRLQTKIWGEFNLANICTAILVGVSLGHNIQTLFSKAEKLTGVLGRISPIMLPNGSVAVIDYAHTPDALQNVLQSVRDHTDANLICLFGCGGDRDTLKRPLMATIAETYADAVIVTDDNPRTEPADKIIEDIMSGARLKSKFSTISGRAEAIANGLSQLQAGDVLVIAGKGHEDYQIIGEEKTHFSDFEHVKMFIENSMKNSESDASNDGEE